ncbi:MAG: radical SAM protein [Candidatus Cloacimonetes bacterium]|nr:radical SAM protein [Candidatus Cloacimonadota bacterium]
MIREITAKSMLHYHERTFSTNWDANIYRGCEHNCRYCFAQYSHRYLETENSLETSFFKDIFVKTNASQILAEEFGKRKWKKLPVNVCGISDCYQPAEAKYKIMPSVFNSFIMHKNPLVIVTKSTLVLRDIELIKELNKVTDVLVIISVSTLNEKKRKLLEPNAASTIERLKMLREFKNIGCNTSVLLMPIIPFLTDDQENLDEIFRITKEYDLGSIEAWPLHLHGKSKGVFYSFLQKHYPELLSKYRLLYNKGSVSKEYHADLQNRIRELKKKYSLFSSYKPTKPKTEEWVQPILFD